MLKKIKSTIEEKKRDPRAKNSRNEEFMKHWKIKLRKSPREQNKK